MTEIPTFHNCDDCEDTGWVEPLDMPNDPFLAKHNLEPCPNCIAGEKALDWLERREDD
jgi:hypothetical protein